MHRLGLEAGGNIAFSGQEFSNRRLDRVGFSFDFDQQSLAYIWYTKVY